MPYICRCVSGLAVAEGIDNRPIWAFFRWLDRLGFSSRFGSDLHLRLIGFLRRLDDCGFLDFGFLDRLGFSSRFGSDLHLRLIGFLRRLDDCGFLDFGFLDRLGFSSRFGSDLHLRLIGFLRRLVVGVRVSQEVFDLLDVFGGDLVAHHVIAAGVRQ
ncbi:MAG: hypothetical protein OXF30_02270 [Candidatus Saccharibacteria bacterium]|nr:hypothetical protein [Candidatus Saccharibacteria bacterium]